jgi:hypothetical protein
MRRHQKTCLERQWPESLDALIRWCYIRFTNFSNKVRTPIFSIGLTLRSPFCALIPPGSLFTAKLDTAVIVSEVARSPGGVFQDQLDYSIIPWPLKRTTPVVA